MIQVLRGTVLEVGLDRVVVSVGGVGLLLHCPPAVAGGCRTGGEVTVWTTLVVREDSLTLYGFAAREERDMFDAVQTVSGVGPRLALAMLTVFSSDELRRVLVEADTAALTKVPGIGAKGAQRLVLELRDKVGPPDPAAAGSAQVDARAGVSAAGLSSRDRDQVVAALVGLGWAARPAEAAVGRVVEREDVQAVPALLRAALQELGR